MTDNEPDSKYGVICWDCGPQGLNSEQYLCQMMAPDALWQCPVCGRTARWDDPRYEAACDAEFQSFLEANPDLMSDEDRTD